MKIKVLIFLLAGITWTAKDCKAQIDENEVGAWYMYFFNKSIDDSPWGLQGDIQYRNWNVIGDLEQLLIRSGITFSPENADIKFTLGYGNITTGTFGESTRNSSENRIYQEALFPSAFGNRFFLKHRFRYEQRFADNQDFRTRYRYNLFVNVPLSSAAMNAKTVYLALYNELFINGQKDIGNNQTVEIFDRNRFYYGFGYIIQKGLNVQFGMMNQTTSAWAKNQLQFSLHRSF
jgi:hypothetical protein